MADERVVSIKLEQIEQYHGELAEKQETLSQSEFRQSTTEQRAVERMFENAIQACSDLAQHIATNDFGYGGNTSKEAVRVLARNDVIEEETMETLDSGFYTECLPKASQAKPSGRRYDDCRSVSS